MREERRPVGGVGVNGAGGPLADIQQLITDEPPAADGDGGGGEALGWLNRLCRAAVRSLPASGVGLSVMGEPGTQGVLAASSTATRLIEELQFTLGEGPCRDAYATRRPVLVPDLSGAVQLTAPHQRAAGDAGQRWPGYAPAVQDLGVRAVFAFPLQVGAGRLGVLDVYREAPEALSPPALTRALGFAEVAVMTLLDGQAGAAAGRVPEGFGDALGDRLVVHQAQGMVMVQLGVPIEEAMVRLRARAYATDRRIADLATDVVARRIVFEPDAR